MLINSLVCQKQKQNKTKQNKKKKRKKEEEVLSLIITVFVILKIFVAWIVSTRNIVFGRSLVEDV